jgi:hypothetical protein
MIGVLLQAIGAFDYLAQSIICCYGLYGPLQSTADIPRHDAPAPKAGLIPLSFILIPILPVGARRNAQ